MVLPIFCAVLFLYVQLFNEVATRYLSGGRTMTFFDIYRVYIPHTTIEL